MLPVGFSIACFSDSDRQRAVAAGRSLKRLEASGTRALCCQLSGFQNSARLQLVENREKYGLAIAVRHLGPLPLPATCIPLLSDANFRFYILDVVSTSLMLQGIFNLAFHAIL